MTRGLPASPEGILVTRGSQMAIDLLARLLLGPGDVAAVEELGHPNVWRALGHTGARLVPLPLDRDGLAVAPLARLLATAPLRALYLTPHHQFPTTRVMPAERRREILALAARHRVAVIEDDYDHEFHYDARPVSPLAGEDRAGVVIYVGTLSKILAPGLRLGFVVAPPEVITRLARLRMAMDLQGDHVVDCAVAELFEDGDIQRHVHRMRAVYARRRDVLIAALRRDLGHALSFDVPAGGMAVWAKVAEGIDVDAWATAGAAERVAFRGGGVYAFDGARVPYTRLAFTFLDEDELGEAVRRMARALPAGVKAAGRRRPR